jgi:nicotinate-nucleotide pyrophosphorylase (carboxylating)
MLDNFDPKKLKETARNLKQQFPSVIIEASGGVTLDTLTDYMSDDVDIISMGNLTQGRSSVPNRLNCLGVAHVDFSLKVKYN